MRATMWLPAVVFVLCQQVCSAQKVSEQAVKIGKNTASGFVAECKYSKDQVDEAISGELDKAGLGRRSRKKKFYTYRGTNWTAVGPAKMDVYYKVQKKKHHAKVYMVVSKGYDNYVTSANDAVMYANINVFLSNIDAVVQRNEDIKAKQAEVTALDDKLAKDKANMQQTENEKRQKVQELQQMKQDK